MIHFTKEGGRKKVGLNLYRARGGFVVAWVWYYPATHELKGGRFRLRMHMKPRILWSVDSCNVIANYLTIHDLQLVNREVLVDLVALGNEGSMTKQTEQEPVGYVSEGEPDRLIAQKQTKTPLRNYRLFTHDVPLYTTPHTKVGCVECRVSGGHAFYCVACAKNLFGGYKK